MKAILITTLMLAAVDAEQLQITVYDKTRSQQQLHATTANVVRRIFREAGIAIEWIDGDTEASEASVMIYQPSHRGRELEDACSARRDIALDMSPAPPGLRKTVLGMAQPLARTGLNVRVFDDHVREASEREHRAPAIVLAHVIAHEIGHVLLRSNVHSQRGLMSEVWTKHEYDWMDKGALLFTADESRKMGMMLNRATCRTLELMRDGTEVRTRDPEAESEHFGHRGKLAHGARATRRCARPSTRWMPVRNAAKSDFEKGRLRVYLCRGLTVEARIPSRPRHLDLTASFLENRRIQAV